jgi:hypothetical protein
VRQDTREAVSCGGTFCRPRMNFTSAHITMHPGLSLTAPGSSPEQAAVAQQGEPRGLCNHPSVHVSTRAWRAPPAVKLPDAAGCSGRPKKKPGLRRAFSCHIGIAGNGSPILPRTAYMLPLLGC